MNDDELNTLLSDTRPVVEPDAGAEAGARAKLHAEFRRADVGATASGRERRVRRMRLAAWFAAPGLVAGAVAVALVATQAMGPAETPRRHADGGHSSTSVRPSPGKSRAPNGKVVRTLDLAAHTVELQDSKRPRPHQWIYTRYVTHKGGKVHEDWVRFDGKKAAEYSTVPGHEGFEISDLEQGQGENTPAEDYDFFASLPTDPAKLRQALYERSLRNEFGPMSHDARIFEYVYDFFEDSPLIPPKNLAALYRALATLPGVTVDTHATDALGRPGIAVTHDQGGGFKESLILDKKDYHVIGQATVDKHGKKHRYAVSVPRVVDEAGQRK